MGVHRVDARNGPQGPCNLLASPNSLTDQEVSWLTSDLRPIYFALLGKIRVFSSSHKLTAVDGGLTSHSLGAPCSGASTWSRGAWCGPKRA